jgi:hypothetical protein
VVDGDPAGAQVLQLHASKQRVCDVTCSVLCKHRGLQPACLWLHWLCKQVLQPARMLAAQVSR